MDINWVLADTYQVDPAVDLDKIKSLGPVWGSWRTWRSCGTDNVICHDKRKAQELVKRDFQSSCNLYIARQHYQDIGRPTGVNLYEGDFSHELDHAEDIVALHLAAGSAAIVLLLGFNLGKIPAPEDRFEKHKLTNYHGMIRSAIKNHPDVQWVVVDHPESLDLSYQNLPNITCDTLENVLQFPV